MVGTIIPGWVGESPCIENIAELSRDWEGGYGSSAIVDRKASKMSFLDVSTSGEVEKRSLKLVGVHAVEGSNEATDSVTLAVDIRPVRINVKSNVGLEVTALVGIGVQPAEVETVVAGERLLCGSERLRWWAKRLRVSSLGGG